MRVSRRGGPVKRPGGSSHKAAYRHRVRQRFLRGKIFLFPHPHLRGVRLVKVCGRLPELARPMLVLTQLSNDLTLKGSFSAVSKPNFASKYALESSRRDLHNALLCTVLESNPKHQENHSFAPFSWDPSGQRSLSSIFFNR